jgi:hypothetical protein
MVYGLLLMVVQRVIPDGKKGHAQGVSLNATNDCAFSPNATKIYVNGQHHYIASNDAEQHLVTM